MALVLGETGRLELGGIDGGDGDGRFKRMKEVMDWAGEGPESGWNSRTAPAESPIMGSLPSLLPREQGNRAGKNFLGNSRKVAQS